MIGWPLTSAATNRPTVNSSESPGRIANSPHSAKMMNATPQSANGPKSRIRYSGSIHDGNSIGTSAAASRGSQAQRYRRRLWIREVRGKGDDPLEPPQGVPRHGFRRNALSDDDLAGASGELGVGPHPQPWPDDPRLDPELLAQGDRRNVVDRYRYWSVPAIVADLDRAGICCRSPSRTGSTISTSAPWCAPRTPSMSPACTSSAAAAGTGAAPWSPTATCTSNTTPRSPISRPGPRPTRTRWSGWTTCPAPCRWRRPLPERVCLVFGSEGPGLTEELASSCQQLVAITQHGSTRSLNAGAAAAIAMYHWALRWARPAQPDGLVAP